jgi:hypothetical protein
MQKVNSHLYCGVFTPRKGCNLETRSRDYATVDKAVFSPCQAEPRSAMPWRVASPRLVCCQATARVGKGHVTTSAVMSHVSTVTQQLKHYWKECFPPVRSRVYTRDWSSFTRSSRWETAAGSSWVASCEQSSCEDLKCDVKILCVILGVWDCGSPVSRSVAGKRLVERES